MFQLIGNVYQKTFLPLLGEMKPVFSVVTARIASLETAFPQLNTVLPSKKGEELVMSCDATRGPPDLEGSKMVHTFLSVLKQAIERRVLNLPLVDNPAIKEDSSKAGRVTGSNLGILFSGGVDSVVMAALADL